MPYAKIFNSLNTCLLFLSLVQIHTLSNDIHFPTQDLTVSIYRANLQNLDFSSSSAKIKTGNSIRLDHKIGENILIMENRLMYWY